MCSVLVVRQESRFKEEQLAILSNIMPGVMRHAVTFFKLFLKKRRDKYRNTVLWYWHSADMIYRTNFLLLNRYSDTDNVFCSVFPVRYCFGARLWQLPVSGSCALRRGVNIFFSTPAGT